MTSGKNWPASESNEQCRARPPAPTPRARSAPGPLAMLQAIDLARGSHDLEQAERTRVNLFDGAPHVDGHHRPAVDHDLVALASDRPHPRVGTTAAADLAREPHDVVRPVADQRRDSI